ncbi:hypothetical protein NBEOAGPD_2231 [Methylobacterium gregans]|uniref:Uncharacterized protein n=2 Tax=Methylobacterium gregans TaxID=374424 RepID=A0AA37HP78_9HYPH|nr:hypothetical protein NBEOAGPD_2231 [Methylobacterium gregans]GJE68659.1 hypothetical protein CHKEEEPN_0177 [Methylorubrum podarium]
MPARARPAATTSSISPTVKSSTTMAASSAAWMASAPAVATDISISMEKGVPANAATAARRP